MENLDEDTIWLKVNNWKSGDKWTNKLKFYNRDRKENSTESARAGNLIYWEIQMEQKTTARTEKTSKSIKWIVKSFMSDGTMRINGKMWIIDEKG